MTSPQFINYKKKSTTKWHKLSFNPGVRLFDIKGAKVFLPWNKN